jgi:NADPH:quinone reductase-like Zn-dependent oxidoreductase
MMEAVRLGKLTIPIVSRFPLRNAAEAHAALAKGSAGKILLLP